ncbi:MAG TPA: OmpA family protein [Pseudomonas xinjiangensis]|uniref:OmpA family protein n=2 Tax=root TaxID=1 RepID=A0A7V1BR36_9GAMM|nr:OmpA family protein [Halopseudomonas xinjiangensis]HEC47916.1 OmpA family protein [Halopseudomonas xinjiangensis]
MLRYIFLYIFLLAVSSSVAADSPDHPLLNRYPGSSVAEFQTIGYERFSLPTGLPADGVGLDFPTLDLIGDLTRHTYRLRGVSTLKIYENYKAALERANFKIIFECALDECGSQRQIKALGASLAINNSVFNNWHDPYYILAEASGEEHRTHVAIYMGGNDNDAAIHQAVVEEVPINRNLIKVNTDYMNRPPKEMAGQVEITAAERAEDHSLLSRYPGARIREFTHEEYQQFTLPTGTVSAYRNADDFDNVQLIGDLTKHFYLLENVSTLKVYENYKNALKTADFEILYECSLGDCGSSTDVRALGALIATTGNVYNYYRDPYYLVARRDTLTGPAYIGLFIGRYRAETAVQQVVVETRDAQVDLIAINTDLLHRELEESGRASIYGIYFDTNKSEVKPESKAAMDTVADLLEEYPELQLYVVGHTDDVGAVEYNVSLSSDRADAVVKRLVTEHGIDPKRLHAAGVGPFSPSAANNSEEGRKLNRRVELVTRLP